MPEPSLGPLRALRRRRAPAQVVVLTNYADPQYQKKCRELGARYVLDKTKEFDRVIEVLTKPA